MAGLASTRGTFHLPPATDKPARFVTTGQTDFVIPLHRNSRLARHHSLLSSACCPIGRAGTSPVVVRPSSCSHQLAVIFAVL